MMLRDILVQLQSVVSGHKINLIRPRLDEKMEIIRFDPWSNHHFVIIPNKLKYLHFFSFFFLAVRMMSIYKETKKVRSM